MGVEYSFDEHTATLRSKQTHRRMLVMGSDSWASLQDGLYKRFSTGASIIILEMESSLGETLFDSLSVSNSGKPEAGAPSLQDLGDLMSRTACGKYSITGNMERGSELSFSIRNCVFCEGKNAEEYKCNFVRGITLGFSTKLYGKEFKSTIYCLHDHQGHLCKSRSNK